MYFASADDGGGEETETTAAAAAAEVATTTTDDEAGIFCGGLRPAASLEHGLATPAMPIPMPTVVNGENREP